MTPKSIALWTAAATVVLAAGAAAQQRPSLPPYLANFDAAHRWGFAPKLTPPLPGDAFVPAKEALEAKKQFPLVQRLFDLWSWQAFLAVNWPTGPNGQPASSIKGYGKSFWPAWQRWHESNQIFLAGGAPPSACKQTLTATARAPARILAALERKGVPQPPPAASESGMRVIFNVSAVGELAHGHTLLGRRPNKGLSEIDQAFSGPLFDQERTADLL